MQVDTGHRSSWLEILSQTLDHHHIEPTKLKHITQITLCYRRPIGRGSSDECPQIDSQIVLNKRRNDYSTSQSINRSWSFYQEISSSYRELESALRIRLDEKLSGLMVCPGVGHLQAGDLDMLLDIDARQVFDYLS